MIFDTHLHLVDRKRLSYPWLEGAPHLNRDWTYDEYAKSAACMGITDALHMEVDVAEVDIDAETAFVADLMQKPGSLIRGAISAARPESDAFVPWLERVDRSVVKGVRRVLHVVPDDVSQTPLFRKNIGRLGRAGLPFDIVMLARQLPLARALVDACPETVFVLDHCGVPDIEGGAFDPWAAEITELARRPHVNIKLSGITAYTGGAWTFGTMRPWVAHVISTFGPARIVWGSDSPVCTLHSNLPEWVAASHALLAELSAEERDAVFQGNARRIWQI
ncbi:amidohydrolase family protein [Pseudotabrizicola algicola]|uniref:Amidohydrolase family protein n=1 Tax=Pseudotabrizicola algicola TaxID=2709381 RepID=A0A6B3RKF9_9RHOB|nr:amidohydrolase [Pseudotabrizicola algicola]NEX46520.1 amidohydrolase family protein [Pseudotabrizicola algicola]